MRHFQPDEDETPESLQEGKAQGRRVSDEEGSGDLDLNATPLGFDLNAPVEEEEVLQAKSEWEIAHQDVEMKPDIGEASRINHLPLEVTSCDQPEAENKLLVGHENSQALTNSEEVYEPVREFPDEDNVGLSSKEEEGSDQGESLSLKAEEDTELEERPRVTIPAVFRRTFEHLNITTSSDGDLDILRSVWSSWQQEDAEALDMTLAGMLEELGKHALSPSRYLLLTSMYVSKRIPEAFSLPRTFKVLLSILESAAAQTVVKRQSLLPILACKLLFRAFTGEPDWPIEFVQMYLLDSTGSRAWIDHEGCKEFVSNVLTAFPDSVLDVPTVSEDTIYPKSTEQGGTGDLQQVQAVKVEAHGSSAVKSRYSQEEIQQKVRAEFCQSLNPLLGAASSKENPRQLLRLLMQGAGFEEVRVVASSMLEGWLNNPVHLRAAKSLLDQILQHTRGTSENDFNTVANLLALRVSTTQAPGQIKSIHNNIFSEMITHLVRRRPEYAALALKTFVTTELQNKNSHNIKSIITVLKALRSEDNPPEHELAIILQELAASDESHGRLCDLVRRMMKQAGGEFDVHVLCVGLIQPWPLMAEQDELLKESWIYKLVDLICQLLLHAASPFVEDEGLFNTITSLSHLGTPVPGCGLERSISGGPSRDKFTMLKKLSSDTQNFQVQAMEWCTDVVAVYLPHIEHAHFKKIVRQLLFLEEVEAYFPYWDPAMETKAKCVKLMGACTRAPEEIVARLILMGLSNFPMESVESLDIIQALVKRAANLEKLMEGSLAASSSQLPAALFKLASFNLRGVSRQPVPQLVVKDLYWQACLVVLILAVFNPSTIGHFVWESVPSLRSLMEVLVAGGRAFLSRASEGSQLEFEKAEAVAVQLDMKAEDVVGHSLADLRSTESSMVDWDDLEFSETEWKGRLMILNHSDPICRPTQSVYDKLHQLNETYQLGYLLRKCRSPDFFAEVTALQTLQQAWPWLQSIVSREPEVVSHFPTAWQCELLYMLEGGHPTMQKLSVDLQQLQADLRQVVSTPSNERKINTIIGFLARKLGSKHFSVRYRARMCLSSLLQTNIKLPNLQVSLPPSPPEHKRAETVSGLPSRLPVHAVDTAAFHHLKMPTVCLSGSSSLYSSPGISLGVAVATSSAERTRTALLDTGVEDHTAWLTSLEALRTASTLVSVLLPSVQVAIQQETSISVVMAYLDFLKKHASPLPSRHSMACSLAFLIMQGKLPTTSLLSDPPALSSAFSSYFLGSKSRLGTMDLILEALLEALETGTVSDSHMDETASEFHMVTLASPQYLGNEQVVRRVSLHKVVVDASLKVLSFLALKCCEGYEKNQVFSRLLNILFPDTQLPLAWIEDRNGEKISLLTEDQALLFARCNTPQLIRAGLAALSLSQKLDVCEKLGLSSVAAISLLEDLDTVTQDRLEAELGPRGSFCQRAKKLQKCVSALMQQGDSGIHFSGLLDVYTPFAFRDIPQPQILYPHSKFECVNDAASTDSGCATLSSEELAGQLFELLPAGTFLTDCTPSEHRNVTNASTYVNFRLTTQQALLCINDDNERCVVLSVIRCMHSVANPNFDESLSSIFPNLETLERIDHHDLPDALHTLVSRIQIEVEAQSLKAVKNQDPPRMSEPRFIGRREAQLIDSVNDLALKKLSQVSFHRLEWWLRLVLRAKLDVDWRFKEDTYREDSEDGNLKHKNGMFILEMLDLLNIWRLDHGNEQQTSTLNERVRLTGRCALICEHLMFIDSEFLSAAHLGIFFEDKILCNDRTMFSFAKLALDCIIQSSSWQSVSRILKAILGAFMNQDGKICKGENSDINKSTLVNCMHEEVGIVYSYHEKVQRTKVLDEASCVLEFILFCMRHPRTILSCRSNEELDPLEGIQTFLSFVDSGSTEALAILAVADLMATKPAPLRPRNDLEEVNYSCKFPLSSDLIDQPGLVSPSRALKVLLVAACKGKRILSTIIEKLLRVGKGSDADMLYSTNVKPELKERSMTTFAGAAQELMAGLDVAFPVSVRTVLQSVKDQKSPVIDLSSFLEDDKFILGKCWQTYTLNSVLHRALRSICKDGEKEARSAYGFCHDMARQHPSLVVPHLPTLSVLLKEMLPMVKQQDSQGRSAVARTYSLCIGLLDALRPYLLADNMSHLSMPNRKAALEVILGFYFEFLRCLEVQDRPQFAKVVARLADFLCHCVDAGGYYRDYVLSYRAPVLQSAVHKFGKIKKLGFLLGMLDKSEHTWGNTLSKSFNGADEGKTPVSGSLIGPLPLEDVLKVRTQLLQCIRWHRSKKPQDSRLELFHSRVNPCSAWYEMKGLNVEEVNLAATLSDLERASARMPTILSALEDSLLELTDINDPNVRDRAYILLERLLLHCPSESSASNILQRLLEQLSSSDTSLAKTAARQASRFYYYCSEFQETVLVEMLQMGCFASDDLPQLLQGLFTVYGGPL